MNARGWEKTGDRGESPGERASLSGPPAGVAAVLVLSLTAVLSCGRAGDDENESGGATKTSSALTAACTSSTIKVLDLHADFRDIWKGRETPDTGKQADPNLKVGIDFDTTVQPSQVTAQFLPVKTDGTCGTAVSSAPATALIAAQAWGTSTSDAARAPFPEAFNVLVRDSISGIVSAGGPIAAGGDVALSSMSVNGTVRAPVGLIAGGKVTVSNGSVAGDLSYGVQSSIPQTVTVSGAKSLQPFAVAAAFQDLASLATLLAEETPTGTAVSSNGTLLLTGTKTTLNVFQVSADALSQASSVQLVVPANAGTIVNVTGNMTVGLQNKGISLQGATASTLLWNIPTAAFVQISSVSLPGSILAPRSLVTFDSGNINGTLVAAAFVSSGSGSLQNAALNVTKLLGSTTPSLVRLTPAQALVRGCAYQFVLPATTPLTTAGGCLSAPIGVTFRVSTSAAPPAGRELTRIEPDPVLHTLRRFTARAGINTPLDDVWPRYEGAIGIAVSNLVPTTISVPSSTIVGQTITTYQQYAQGYPVVGYGYFVASQGGIFRAANGKVAPGLPVFPAAAVGAAAALQNALTFLKITQAPWVTKPAVNHAPAGRLVVAAKRVAAKGTDFALAWDFRFGGSTGINNPIDVQVDAATGAVLAVDPGQVSLTTLGSLATYSGQTVGDTVDTVYDGAGRPFQAAAYQTPGQTAPAAILSSGDFTAPGALSTATGVTDDSLGNFFGTPQYALDPTPATPWTSTEPAEQRMASVQWALERSDVFMKGLGLQVVGAPWLNVDGPTALEKLRINYVDGPPTLNVDPAHYSYTSTPDLGQIFLYRALPIQPFQANVVAHEYAHALVHSLRRAAGLVGPEGAGTMSLVGESGSVGEGISDLFAVGFNHSQVNPTGTWYCLQFDIGGGPVCYRNIRDPLSSAEIPIAGRPSGLPDLYQSVAHGYLDFSTPPAGGCNGSNDNCGAHLNSSIVSHWGYLLGVGTGTLPVPCGIAFDPLDPDPDTSLRMAINIALRAVGTRTALTTGGVTSPTSFADFRDATLQVADEMVQSNLLPATAVAKIELAWAAVGLPPFASQSDVAAPANVSNAYPWATFTWPLTGDGQSGAGKPWDFQITTDTFDDLAFHQDAITGVSQDSLNGVLPLALPPGVADTFLWRVRPHDSSAWLSCYPVHSFTGTTVPDTVNNMQVVKELESVAGKVVPGPFDVSWDFVRGTVAPNYDSWIGTTKSSQCPPGSEATNLPTDGLSDDGVTQSDSVGFITQPEAHYFMTVQPSGPPDFTGATALGACATLEFDTGDLAPPTYDQPGFVATAIFATPWSPGSGLKWETSGGAAKSLVYLFDRDENGVCGTTPIGDPITVTLSGAATSIGLVPSLPGNTTLPNPTGYCWDVVDVAANGDQSAPSSPPGQFGFLAEAPTKTSPGVVLSDTVQMIPAPIPGDSYNVDVVFDWTTAAQPGFPAAPAYGLRVGRWPWSQPLATPEPANGAPFDAQLGSTTPTTDFTKIFRAGDVKKVLAVNAGQGRYCWSVWPILDDPSMPGQAWVRQPSVSLDPIWCYTTGPATPLFNMTPGDNYSVGAAPAPAVFSTQPIQGELELDYIPNAQVKAQGSSSDITFGTGCTAVPGIFKDVYDCKVPFTIAPQPGATYTIDVWTYNSDAATPVMNDTTQVHHVVETIKTGQCGAKGQSCCPGDICTDAVCQNSKCADSPVQITSPADGSLVPPNTAFDIKWTDPNPPKVYDLSVQPASGVAATGFTTRMNATNDATSEQVFQVSVAQLGPINGASYVVRVCAEATATPGTSIIQVGCQQHTFTIGIKPPPPPPPPACSPPVVPSVPHCEGPFDSVNIDFKPVSGGVEYVVEYTRPDLGVYTKTYDAASIESDFNVDSSGNFISTPVWYSPADFEPTFSGIGSFRVRVVTGNCMSDYSPPSVFDNTASQSCLAQGYCADLICKYVAPPN